MNHYIILFITYILLSGCAITETLPVPEPKPPDPVIQMEKAFRRNISGEYRVISNNHIGGLTLKFGDLRFDTTKDVAIVSTGTDIEVKLSINNKTSGSLNNIKSILIHEYSSHNTRFTFLSEYTAEIERGVLILLGDTQVSYFSGTLRIKDGILSLNDDDIAEKIN